MLTLRSNDAIRFALEAVTVLILKKLTVPARRHAKMVLGRRGAVVFAPFSLLKSLTFGAYDPSRSPGFPE